MGVEHLKLVVRPGEAEFVYEASPSPSAPAQREQAGLLLDDGFMVTMDYGADGEALVWQALSHPNFEGIHTMDARAELAADCTEVSYLECPGLQDITTSIDFTEVAEAGRRLGGWEVAAYGPLFLLELAFGDQSLSEPVPHLIERAGGARTVGLHAWYRKAEGDPWASFKVLVQRRGNSGSWALGPPGLSWPLEASPRLSRPPSDCWGLDLSKPPLAAAVTRAAAAVRAGPAGAVRGSAPGPGAEEEVRALAEAFGTVLKGGIHLDQEHAAQKQAYREMHLALMLADYWLHLARLVGPERCANPGEDERAHWLSEVRSLAATRRLPELHGEAMFDQATRGSLVAAHAAAGLCAGESREALRLVRAAEGLLRAAAAVLGTPAPTPAAGGGNGAADMHVDGHPIALLDLSPAGASAGDPAGEGASEDDPLDDSWADGLRRAPTGAAAAAADGGRDDKNKRLRVDAAGGAAGLQVALAAELGALASKLGTAPGDLRGLFEAATTSHAEFTEKEAGLLRRLAGLFD
ncbi:unnamed protein product [Prorocentrum cordatum]|uniref:Uncharacterized protein n=1 Tax=Prorocentrum cordatum TaxID=2364126 RepID=A0ABN9V341_9DINO|nr:unnamed protein product [Polarella glacialis]